MSVFIQEQGGNVTDRRASILGQGLFTLPPFGGMKKKTNSTKIIEFKMNE